MLDARALSLSRGTVLSNGWLDSPGPLVVAPCLALDLSLRGARSVTLGRASRVRGDVHAGGDVRIGAFVHVGGFVQTAASARVGEGARVGRRLTAGMDLDVAAGVHLLQGFDAPGWVRRAHDASPLALALRRRSTVGGDAETDRVLAELSQGDVTFLPASVRFHDDEITLEGPMKAAPGCRLDRALCARGDVELGDACEVLGGITATGVVRLGDASRIHGPIQAARVEFWGAARVDGGVHAQEGVRFLGGSVDPPSEALPAPMPRADVMSLLGPVSPA